MQIAILKVILWPKNRDAAPRMIDFMPGKINVITGESGTGKSTLTAIIDYCLGSEKCTIPVGLIRNTTAWFGLLLKLANTELLVARRNPEDQQTTTDLYWAEGLKLEVPALITKNARLDDLKQRFNQIAQLPSLEVLADDENGHSRPSYRDMAAFNFQPQHIVANPFTMFFKADTTEHREKLRIVFPFALGAVDVDTLAKQRELRDIERTHDKLRRELDARLAASRAWESEIESYYLQAQMLGLLPNSPASESGWPLERYLLELSGLPGKVQKLDLPDMPPGTGEAAVDELTRLVNEEDRLSQTIGAIRRRLANLDQLSATVGDYQQTLTNQKDRLQVVGWLERKMKDTHKCPVCNADHTVHNPRLDELRTIAGELRDLSVSVSEAPAKLEQEVAVLRVELREGEAALSKVRHKRKGLEDRSNAIAAQRQKIRQIYLFVGRVEQALENVRTSRNVGDLSERVAELAAQIAKLRRELDPFAQRERLKAAISTVSARIAHYSDVLKLEHSSENVRLNIRELTLQFSPLSGRTDYLWEVGSGQNWVGYHIACLLALHEHFLQLKHSPVPRFLIIDQPSQVYFPEAWPSADELPEESDAQSLSADIEGVRRLFGVMAHFMDSVKTNFQIIVAEHAGAITWNGFAHVHFVGNWRRGKDEFLIPDSWIE